MCSFYTADHLTMQGAELQKGGGLKTPLACPPSTHSCMLVNNSFLSSPVACMLDPLGYVSAELLFPTPESGGGGTYRASPIIVLLNIAWNQTAIFFKHNFAKCEILPDTSFKTH